mmetsp:Transcript_4133/g.10682  ORF Transcript_4133/g.10682 Transcript_4133/m.10682 type:complete len:108 (-) Transcript_4133:166-489(-)|eukprot:CAMPEP_0119414854 /NCGR_PEP_ID=MMETSP1335-20130426/7212_1 /TAXON_ID=259385 /ORGANISM="Chrysoculter rhomboideus, Strain RCC1486" /LENGTH=107 /DNA_ID=CAMNT_0007439749 /DNA_START=133 /DNA_END=456 /DNA_ORIENTATION=+
MSQQMYVRVKRKNQTIFMYVEPSETVEAVKGKIEGVMKVPASEMRLFIYNEMEASPQVMADKDTLEKLKIEPEQELALVYKVPGTDDYEPIDIATDGAGGGDEKGAE